MTPFFPRVPFKQFPHGFPQKYIEEFRREFNRNPMWILLGHPPGIYPEVPFGFLKGLIRNFSRNWVSDFLEITPCIAFRIFSAFFPGNLAGVSFRKHFFWSSSWNKTI